MSDYLEFRGKCKELSEQAAASNPELRVVRGFYTCPIWRTREPHWWCVDGDGKVVDPSAKQFPSKGNGFYEEFDGYVECAECGKQIHEDEADIEGNYAFCSYTCHGRFVGVF